MAGGGAGDGRSPRIDLVPIIDAMTCVIFFLLLSSTFVEFTKITMPSAVSAVATTVSEKSTPPLSPKIFGLVKDQNIYLILSWEGETPGHLQNIVPRHLDNARSQELQLATQGLVDEFKKKFPQENTLQLGLSAAATYQEMISAMDGARLRFSDLVMVSWNDESLFTSLIKE